MTTLATVSNDEIRDTLRNRAGSGARWQRPAGMPTDSVLRVVRDRWLTDDGARLRRVSVGVRCAWLAEHIDELRDCDLPRIQRALEAKTPWLSVALIELPVRAASLRSPKVELSVCVPGDQATIFAARGGLRVDVAQLDLPSLGAGDGNLVTLWSPYARVDAQPRMLRRR